MEVVTKAITEDITQHTALSGGEVTGGSEVNNKLSDILLKSQFQFYHKSRTHLKATIRYDGTLELFQRFSDSEDNNKQYVLTYFRRNMTSSIYEIELTEYDNTTEINLT